MNFTWKKPRLLVVAFIAGLAFVPFGFFALVAALDFDGRGCDIVPRSSWAISGNCGDAHSTMWFAGLIALAALGALCWSVWRLRHV